MKSVIHSIVIVLTAGWMMLIGTAVYADAPAPVYDHVHLQADATREVANDEMRVVLAAEKRGTDAAELADAINKDMSWALATISDAPGSDKLTTQMRAYQTYPNYVQGKINGWVSSQELLLRSRDSASLTTLLGQLQGRLLVRSMNFSVSKARQVEVENELIGEAMEAFKRRAELVQKHMQDRDYRIVELHINTQSGGDYRPMMEMANRTRAAASQVARPAVESGNSELRVSVTGRIEFQLP